LKKQKTIKSNVPRGRAVFEELRGLLSERPNPHTKKIDCLPPIEILRLINDEDARVAIAVQKEIPYIARAVEMVARVLKNRGRLFYLGAGTSGRLGVLDASECPPTFGTDPSMIRGIIAGGYKSLVRSREGVEDDISAAKADIRRNKIGPRDIVIGITASRRTPYVLAGLRESKRLGAATIFLTCNPRKDAPTEFDLAICPIVGPEVIAGSSRMKAGTAQKMILNMITTAAMILNGRVYGNRMVDLKATSEKLIERSKRVLMEVCKIEYKDAEKLLKRAEGSVKTAIVMEKASLTRLQAEKALNLADGYVHRALKLACNKA
jgi:N-acetylmuramic acid 6-phosphate etherase